MNRAGCTIVSPNYFAYARTLAASYLAQHPSHRFFVLIVANLTEDAPFHADVLTPVMLPAIGLADMYSEAMKYDILELNTNVKPTFMKHLIEAYQLDELVYLDPDIFCYAPLEPVFTALTSGATAVLTPHLTTPIFDGFVPGEQEMLYNGTYNLGFIAVRKCEEAMRLLDWWERRCLDLGFSEGRTGLFVDQKWMNLAPGFFDGVAVLRDPGLNMAYWNLHERELVAEQHRYNVAGAQERAPEPLRFFHFSGIDTKDPMSLSRNTDRFALKDRPDLQAIFADYKAAVEANRGSAAEALSYGFDAFSDGTAVTRLARRIYAKHQSHFSGEDPFQADGKFAKFAKKLGLVKGKIKLAKQTWNDFNPSDRRVEAVHRMLKLALRVLGPDKYELLMRYLAHIAILRNQSVFLDNGLPPDPERSR